MFTHLFPFREVRLPSLVLATIATTLVIALTDPTLA